MAETPTDRDRVIAAIERQRTIAVLRFDAAEELRRVVDAIVGGGITLLEVTLTTPDALAIIGELSRRDDVIVGVGSARTREHVRAAADAGARFMASPIADHAMIAEARDAGLLAMPGALTPTEIDRAWRDGADLVKVFPMPRDGAAYLRSVLAPMPEIRLAPSGGVTPDSAAEMLGAGAYALNVGSWLTHDNGAAAAADVVARRAARLVEAVRGIVV
jgi:2-dehydro-3-deoxyphosphogluconate aldolase/(4S)-4-hydroxy-2-oxoglutarate aldolase